MKKKQILIISYSYPPVNAPAAQRPYALAKYLNKNKHNVTIITCSNPDSSMGFDIDFNEELEGVKHIKIPSYFTSKRSSYRSSITVSTKGKSIKQKLKGGIFSIASRLIVPDKAILWLPNVKKYLKHHKELILNTDVLFTTSPLFTNHLIGRYIHSENNNLKWIADFRDFHYVENWSNKESILKKYHKKLELSIIKNATKITFISEAMQKVYEKHYPTYKNCFRFVYNGFDLDDFKNITINPISNNKLTIFYAGSFYKGVRSPFPLLELVDTAIKEKLIAKEDISIKIAGNFEAELIKDAKKYISFKCIEFLGRLSRTEVLKELTRADLLWLIVGNKIMHYTGVPIKFYEYLAARRPIINFAPNKSETTKIIEEHNLGWSFDFTNTNKVEYDEMFSEIILKYKDKTLSTPLPDKIITKFTRDFQAKQFEKIIDG